MFERVAVRAAMVLAAAFTAMPSMAATHTITIDGMQFAPPVLTVKRGDTVVWVNKDLVPHTVIAPGELDSGTIAPNASWSHVAGKPGRHPYACGLHPTMKATLVVE